MKIKLFLIIFFFSLIGYTQINECNDYLVQVKEYHKKASEFYKKKDFVSATKFIFLEQKVYKNNDTLNINYYKTFYVLGKLFSKLEQNSTAIIHYKRYLNFKNFKKKKTLKVLENLSQLYENKGNIVEAIYYRRQLISLLKIERKKLDLIFQYNKLASLYDYFDDRKHLNLQIKTLRLAEDIVRNDKYSDDDFYNLNNGFALYYLKDSIKKYHKSKYYYLANLGLAKLKKDTMVASYMYNNIGELYLRLKKDSAKYYIDKSITINNQFYDKYYYNMCRYYINKDDLQTAIISIQKAINFNVSKKYLYDENRINSIDYINAKNNVFLIEQLKLKIFVLIKMYEKSFDTQYINLALQNIDFIDFIVDKITNSMFESSKLFWRDLISDIYFYGFYCSEISSNAKKAFYYSEKNKSLLLLNVSIEKGFRSKLPKQLQLKISNYKKRMSSKNSALNMRLKYETFVDSIRDIYPTYFKYRKFKKSNILNLENVQDNLKDNEIVIEYISNNSTSLENNLMSLIICKDSVRFSNINQNELILNIKKYKKLVTKPLSTKTEFKTFQKVSNDLYGKLFYTEQIKELIQDKKLIIIPDGLLLNVPFESLMTNTNNYLIEKSNISYAYSLTYLLNKQKIKRNPIKSVLAFAPINFKEQNLYPLLETNKEIKQLKNLFTVDAFKDTLATKYNYISQCKDYNIIHLATHSIINEYQEPVIFFKKDKLTLNELYSIENQADLVVLSACETSLGEMNSGEGVLSLARGFFYGGANTLVSSLWKINDKTSTTLINDFYVNLEKGFSKSKALQQAKIKYLNSHSLSDNSPYYWASFVLIGDGNQLHQLDSNGFIFYIIGFILVLFIFVFFRINKNKGNKNK